MTARQHSHLVVWLLLLHDFCDDLAIDALLAGFEVRALFDALDEIERELANLGILDPSATLAALRDLL